MLLHRDRREQFVARLSDYWELTKPGVTFMVIISTLGGFYLASPAKMDLLLLLNTLAGSWLVSAGTNALNQLIERNIDAKMKRTRNRPLPAGRLQPTEVRWFSVTISVLGIAHLAFFVNVLTSVLALLTLLSYVFLYTPMKRTTSFSTVVGAVPGALPAMGGWAAVRNGISAEAWVLFAILFFWQLPHFLAIAWIYREDYARGGFPVLPVIDEVGTNTGLHVIANCLALLTVSLLPTLLGLTGAVYFWGALICGLAFFASGLLLAFQKSNRSARRLLHASILYLPLLFAFMFLDKAGL